MNVLHWITELKEYLGDVGCIKCGSKWVWVNSIQTTEGWNRYEHCKECGHVWSWSE